MPCGFNRPGPSVKYDNQLPSPRNDSGQDEGCAPTSAASVSLRRWPRAAAAYAVLVSTTALTHTVRTRARAVHPTTSRMRTERSTNTQKTTTESNGVQL